MATKEELLETHYFHNPTNNRLWCIQHINLESMDDWNQRREVTRLFESRYPIETRWGGAGKTLRITNKELDRYWNYSSNVRSMIRKKTDKGYERVAKDRWDYLCNPDNTVRATKEKISESATTNSFRAKALDAEDAALCIIDFD